MFDGFISGSPDAKPPRAGSIPGFSVIFPGTNPGSFTPGTFIGAKQIDVPKSGHRQARGNVRVVRVTSNSESHIGVAGVQLILLISAAGYF